MLNFSMNVLCARSNIIYDGTEPLQASAGALATSFSLNGVVGDGQSHYPICTPLSLGVARKCYLRWKACGLQKQADSEACK